MSSSHFGRSTKSIQLEDCDFKLKCGRHQWNVHIEALAEHSYYFRELFHQPQEAGFYYSTLELKAKDSANDGSADNYEPKHVEEALNLFYNGHFSSHIIAMKACERLLFMVDVHRVVCIWRAPAVARMIKGTISKHIPTFDENQKQISGVSLCDLARVCRYVFNQPDFLGFEWELKQHLANILKKDVQNFVASEEMCSMFNECIFGNSVAPAAV